ncbi:MAG TPA: hypothetical protein EYG91_03875 [Aquifex aeolicus]|nr:hypothetical protein [Aquifex aeolicus]
MSTLGDLIKKAFGDYLPKGTEETKCIPFGCGFIDEKVLLSFKNKGVRSFFKSGKKRPFLIVHSNETHCYLILFSTSPFKFKCKKDSIYGIEEETPEILWKDYCKNSEICERVINVPSSKLYKLILLNGNCFYVVRIPTRMLNSENFVRCGIYPEFELPEKIKEIINGELKKWKT